MNSFCSRLLWTSAGLIIAVGCNGPIADTPRTVPVEGKITYGGGNWPKPAKVSFATDQPAAGAAIHSGSAVLKEDGSFKASTFDEGDGLVPGRYMVNIESWESPPEESPTPVKSIVPEKFRRGTTSGFVVDVPADTKGKITVNFDVPTS